VSVTSRCGWDGFVVSLMERDLQLAQDGTSVILLRGETGELQPGNYYLGTQPT
jgi:hypothetical protein